MSTVFGLLEEIRDSLLEIRDPLLEIRDRIGGEDEAGASSSPRYLIDLYSDGDTLGPMAGAGIGATLTGEIEMIRADDQSIENPYAELAFNPTAASFVAGKIVVVDWKSDIAALRSANLANAGAAGYVLIAPPLEYMLEADVGSSSIPMITISYTNGVVLKSWMTANTNPYGLITSVKPAV